MSELNIIYNNSNTIVGVFKNGMAWSWPDKIKIGKYDESFVYDNDNGMIGKISDRVVVDIIGETVGHISDKNLYITNKKMGHYSGNTHSACAAIVLLFSRYKKV